MGKLFGWLDKHAVEAGVILLLLLIPLYPKFPLLDIPHTWVYIRFEDLVIAVVALIWLIRLVRRRQAAIYPLTKLVVVYWLAGAASLFFCLIFLKSHLANFFPNVAIFHYLRRIEYLLVFFIAASAAADLRAVRKFVNAAAVALFFVCLYGFGQKFLGFPAFLTMNEEFAKGQPLYLSATSRLTSTFAGHYDLAAYLVMMIGIFASLFFAAKRKLDRFLLLILLSLSYILLLFTASRVSLAVYVLVISLVLWLHRQKKLIIPVILISLLVMNFVSGAAQRFAKTFRVQRVVYDAQTGKAIGTVETLPTGGEEIKTDLDEDLPLGSGFIDLTGLDTVTPEATQVAVIKKSGPSLSSLKTATMSSEIATISGEFLIKRALVYDISFTTRFQGTWRRAWRAFETSPLLGTGYSSIGLASDNSYLRALGETGLAGFFAFLSLLGGIFLLVRQGLSVKNDFARSLVIGIGAGALGIGLNALLIDVFEASKVAYTFWIFIGLLAALVHHQLPDRQPLFREAIEVVKSAFVPPLVLVIVGLILFLPDIGNYFVGDDFTWLRWAETGSGKSLLNYFVSADGFFFRPLAKILFTVAYPLLQLRPPGYHLISLFLHLATTVNLYFLACIVTGKKQASLLASFLFLIHPVNSVSALWISSISSLLASFFYTGTVLAYLLWHKSAAWRRPVLLLAVFAAYLLALSSHELAVTLPLMLLSLDFVFKRHSKLFLHLPLWLILAAYFYLRNLIAQAHWLSGDYNYNLAHLPFNLPGNFLGYLGQLSIGFASDNAYNTARSYLRLHQSAAVVVMVVLLPLFMLAVRYLSARAWYKNTRPQILFAILWMIITLLPFLGLGNIASRYVYLAGFGFLLLYSQAVFALKRYLGAAVVGLLICLTTAFLLLQTSTVKKQWFQAGEISNKILLAVGTNYREFPPGSTLYFVDIPIKYGQAWVFPVGLEDGLWLIYKSDSYTVRHSVDLNGTLAVTESDPAAYVFYYQEGQLLQKNKEEPTVE